MECKWESSEKTYLCKRNVYKNSEFCLFHKPNKEEEAYIFWAVINFDPFCKIRSEWVDIFRYNFCYDFKQNPNSILQYFTRTGIVQYNIPEQIICDLESEINDSINYYLESIGVLVNSVLYSIIIDQWKISGIHGPFSGIFSGFVFPLKSIFNYKYFKINQWNTFSFEDVVFEKRVVFENYNFGKYDVVFSNIEMKGRDVNFRNTYFGGSVVFTNTNLASSIRYMGLSPFYNSVFEGQHLKFQGGSIHNLYGIKLSENTDLIIEDNVKVENNFRLEGMPDFNYINEDKETFHIAKIQAERRGQYDLAGKYFYLEKKAEGKHIIKEYQLISGKKVGKKNKCFGLLKEKEYYISKFKYIWNFVSRLTVGYGEKPQRALVSSLFFVVVYGLIYCIFNLLKDSSLGSSFFFLW